MQPKCPRRVALPTPLGQQPRWAQGPRGRLCCPLQSDAHPGDRGWQGGVRGPSRRQDTTARRRPWAGTPAASDAQDDSACPALQACSAEPLAPWEPRVGGQLRGVRWPVSCHAPAPGCVPPNNPRLTAALIHDPLNPSAEVTVELGTFCLVPVPTLSCKASPEDSGLYWRPEAPGRTICFLVKRDTQQPMHMEVSRTHPLPRWGPLWTCLPKEAAPQEARGLAVDGGRRLGPRPQGGEEEPVASEAQLAREQAARRPPVQPGCVCRWRSR